VILSDSDIDSEFVRLKSREGQSEFFVAEIFLPVDESSTEADVKKAADDLSRQLSKDVTKFPAAARQFSQSATAAQGGIIGWVTPDQMDEDTGLALRNMSVQQISQPIKGNDGYRILFLREKRVITLDNGEQTQERMRIKMAVFELPDDEAGRKETRNEVEIFRRDVKGCLDIMRLVTKNKSATLQEFDDVISSIPSQIVDAVTDVQIGEIGKTIESESSLSVPMVCGRDGGANINAVELEIENRIGTQRLDVLQRQYLRDLIADAYIERRV
jgi:peptidyl-prolyl cis-trans isomerase SurA